MRIVSGYSEYEIISLVQAVRKDRESWEGWRALRVKTPALCEAKQRAHLHASTRRILEIYMKNKQGTVFMCGFHAIHVFCKGVPMAVLETIGFQLQELVMLETGRGAHFAVFDVFRDHARFMEAYDYEVPTAPETQEIPSAAGTLPDSSQKVVNLNSRKVLLVEDDPVTRWMVRSALKDECFLMTAQDAGKAIATYQSYKPDMVLLDINLPGHDGREVMTRIMKCDPGAYIVMFSSHDTLENIVETIEDGARGFIAKPFSRNKLIHYVQECPVAR